MGDKMETIKSKLKSFLLKVFVATVGVMLIMMRDTVAEKISEALTVCADVLIPSLFPFMVLSSFASSADIFSDKNRITVFFMNKLFRLPSSAITAVIFGMIGGYPVGARVIESLYADGSISHSDAKHLFTFCVNAGPAFIVSAAGGMIIGSRIAGYIILVSVLLSSFLVGFVYARLKNCSNPNEKYIYKDKTDYSTAIVSAVSSSCSGMLSICSWVIVFMAFSVMVETVITNNTILLLYQSVAEVTSGLPSALKVGDVPFSAACIAFGGISVMCQILPLMKKCGIKVREYLFFRIVNSVFVYFITSVIIKIVSVTIPVASQFTPEIHYAPASAALLIMCAVLIFDLSSGETKKMRIFG